MQHATCYTCITSYYACVARATNNKHKTPSKSKGNAEADSNGMDSMDMQNGSIEMPSKVQTTILYKERQEEWQSLQASQHIEGKNEWIIGCGQQTSSLADS